MMWPHRQEWLRQCRHFVDNEKGRSQFFLIYAELELNLLILHK